ncbi:MAG: 23S rRNA (pseudouridine(1915)-N(3))-methyltransferase RlmH [Acidobacteriota bacterium]|nr:23S rRNA (pseudouridine(1915)-N(3))-methyltransferase RlmH [Acidobacteriota bacterium]
MAEWLEVITVGRTRRGPLLDLEEDYLRRLERLGGCRRRVVPPSKKAPAALRRREEGEALADLRRRRGLTVALDASGRGFDSPTFQRWLLEARGRGGVSFLIGGPDGLHTSTLAAADLKLALGPMTLPHELALVVLLEQLYRALAAEQGHPYARH